LFHFIVFEGAVAMVREEVCTTHLNWTNGIHLETDLGSQKCTIWKGLDIYATLNLLKEISDGEDPSFSRVLSFVYLL
jgi:hypothetical protein